jgi:hypothetical protein
MGRTLARLPVREPPDFEWEKRREDVLAHVRREALDWPHLLDNDYRYWNALGNHYWPAVCLVDRCGRIRARFIGELHGGQEGGERAEAGIEALVEERSC